MDPVQSDPSKLLQIELVNETFQTSLSNSTQQSAKRHLRTDVNTQKKLPLFTSLNPLNLVKHKACRTTHGKRSQEEQVQYTSSSRCCVSETL